MHPSRWRAALMWFGLVCRFCKYHVAMNCIEARPVNTDPYWKTKLRHATKKHLKEAHPEKVSMFFK